MTLTTDLSAKANALIRKPAVEVFDAFVNPETMSRFWFTRRDDGLREGEGVTWYLGAEPDAPRFDVRVTSLRPPHLIVMEWESAGGFTTVRWTFEAKSRDATVVRVEETGYSGDPQAVIDAALDSTGGFNQVLIAAKAWLEHRAPVNVVADHVAE